ncbi:MAG: GAF domain-containing protein [Bacteroidales bacterium]|nr:GAF domain-containing protein [Bacteroidales bacterium]
MEIRKARKYVRIYTQLEILMQSCSDPLARMATINAILYHKMESFSWVGFYLLSNGQLIVGPYQGPLACQVLENNKGVCWACINEQKTITVPDVRAFPGHIACDSRSRSEIVIPLRNKDKEVVGVMDVDSRITGNFDDTDARELEKICSLVYR